MTQHTLAKYAGSLLLLQLFGGMFLNFFLLQQLNLNSPDINVTSTATIMGIATLLAIALSSVNLVVAAIGHLLLNKTHPLHCVLMLAFATIAVGLTAVEYAQMGELTSLVMHFSQQGSQELDQSMLLAKRIVANGRNEIHYMTIALSSFSLLLFYALLYRTTQIPVLLTGFALIACFLQLIALSSTFFQGNVINLIQLPLFITQLIMPIYLIKYGFQLPEKPPQQ